MLGSALRFNLGGSQGGIYVVLGIQIRSVTCKENAVLFYQSGAFSNNETNLFSWSVRLNSTSQMLASRYCLYLFTNQLFLCIDWISPHYFNLVRSILNSCLLSHLTGNKMYIFSFLILQPPDSASYWQKAPCFSELRTIVV